MRALVKLPTIAGMTSALHDQYVLLARYNGWMNQRLYDASQTLSDAGRKLERGAFFGSIHRTLNHIVLGDQIWLRRFMQCGAGHGIALAGLNDTLLDLPAGIPMDTVLFEDWSALRLKREQLDAGIDTWVAGMPGNFPELTMRYANTKGVQRAHPVWQAMTHFFNHQTHHRGQATTLLAQAGVDVGVTDLIALL